MVAGGASPRTGRLLRAAFGLAVVLLALLTGDEPSRAATFTVTNLNDAGAGSFRAAILAANATPNAGGVPDRIEFTVAGVIPLVGVLDPIQESVVIDATTAPGYVDRSVVTVMGAGATNGCMLVDADDVTVTALSVGDCQRGIVVSGARVTRAAAQPDASVWWMGVGAVSP